MKITFGAFISEKRLAKDISLRAFSNMIDISPEYLSKLENDLRAAPKDHTLEKIAENLVLNVDDREVFYDLAAKSKSYLSLASDLVKYVNENEMVHKTLRLAKRYELTNEDWKKIFEYIAKTHL